MNYYLDLVRQKTRKYIVEVILIVVALVVGVGSFVLFLKSSIEIPPKNKISFQDESDKPSSKKIYAEISGAVVKPGVYELKIDSRLNDLLELAEGLSKQADKSYFARNFNLARYIQDQEKVYIPSTEEITKGFFSENDPLQPAYQNSSAEKEGKININSASEKELDSLPGIGQVTAQKIIDNRPYQSVEELLDKKIVKQNVYESIKEQITAN